MSVKEFIDKNIKVHKCSNIEDAKKQEKERLKILGLGGILFVISAIFMALGNVVAIFETLLIIPMIPCLICIMVGVWTWIQAHNEKDRLTFVLCKECSTQFDFDNIKYSFVSERKSTGSPDKNGVIHFSVIHRYAFECKCPKCGAERKFEYDFEERKGTLRNDNNGHPVIINEQPVNVEEKIKDFFS